MHSFCHYERKEQQPLQLWLESFIGTWPELPDSELKGSTQWLSNIHTAGIEKLLNELTPFCCRIPFREMSFNPWEVVGLARKELLNASVLTWLLDPSESHGLGARPLNSLLMLLNTSATDAFPLSCLSWCRLNTEVLPSGDQRNRVDIEVDAEAFYLLIEVKIDAGCQKDQLLRYLQEAQCRSGNRPWKVLYLTPSGLLPANHISENANNIVPLSWRHLANHLIRSLRKELRMEGSERDQAGFLARQSVSHFLNHVRQF